MKTILLAAALAAPALPAIAEDDLSQFSFVQPTLTIEENRTGFYPIEAQSLLTVANNGTEKSGPIMLLCVLYDRDGASVGTLIGNFYGIKPGKDGVNRATSFPTNRPVTVECEMRQGKSPNGGGGD
jgi:hypothetical protein